MNFSVEPDIRSGQDRQGVDKDWDADATKGIPFGSVVTFVVRAGNPKNIRSEARYLRPGDEVTPVR